MKSILVIIFIFFGLQVSAQQVKSFNLVNVLNDQAVSQETYPSCSGMVVIFTSAGCPYDDYYRNRISQIAQAYQDRVPVILVNADPGETKDNMLKKAKQFTPTIPYLLDKDQALMTNLDAKKSTEAFLLKNSNGNFNVVYRGAIDDNAQVESDVRHNYLKDAIDILLTNQKIETAEVRPVGCNLKKK